MDERQKEAMSDAAMAHAALKYMERTERLQITWGHAAALAQSTSTASEESQDARRQEIKTLATHWCAQRMEHAKLAADPEYSPALLADRLAKIYEIETRLNAAIDAAIAAKEAP